MKIVCLNVERAVAHLEKFADTCSDALVQVLRDHAVSDKEVVIDVSAGYITTMTFTSTHEVDVDMEVEGTIITIHEVNKAAVATVKTNHEVVDIDGKPIFADQQNKENTMNNQAQTTASTTPPVYSTEERDALMAKMAAMQAALDEMSKGQPDAAAKPAASAEDNDLALAIGKGVLYTAGAVAVGVGGWFAWKKWGFSSTQA